MVKKKKKGKDIFLIHYRKPNGIYNFKIVLGKEASGKALGLMLKGNTEIKYQKKVD